MKQQFLLHDLHFPDLANPSCVFRSELPGKLSIGPRSLR